MRIDAATHGQEIVAAVLIAEARGEGGKGMAAVAEVNHRRSELKGVSMLSVIDLGTFASLNCTNRDALLQTYHNPILKQRCELPGALIIGPKRLEISRAGRLTSRTKK